jgi:hypothetical protein
MVWANPSNISTANLDANTDSPSLARADIKTAFDELTNIANNATTTYTPAYSATQGTVSIAHQTQQGYYVQMGSIVFLSVFLDAIILYSDEPGSYSSITINLPVAPAITSRYHNNFQVFTASNATGGAAHPSGFNWPQQPIMFADLTAGSTAMGFRLIRTTNGIDNVGTQSDIPTLSSSNITASISGTARHITSVQGFYFA